MASIHIEQHKNAPRSYRVKWRTPDPTRASGWRSGSKSFAKRSDAQLFRAQLEAGVDEVADRVSAAPTRLLEVHQRYTASRRAGRGTLSKEASLGKRLKPLHQLEVAQLRPSDVRTWVAAMVDEGLSAETIGACLRLLRQVLDLAVEDGEASANVAARVKPPRIVRPPLDTADVLDVAEFEAILEDVPPRWRAPFALRAYAGPRLSETFGMRREDVDLLRRRVHVGHRVLEEVDGVAEVRESGKTRGSDRWVPIPDRVVELLGEHLATYEPGRDGLIFTGRDGGYPLRDNLRRRVWEPALGAATVDGVPVTRVTMRNLRHTAASWMLAAGLDPLDVAFRMGHSKPSMTMDVYARFRRSRTAEDPYADVFRRNMGGTSGAETVGTARIAE